MWKLNSFQIYRQFDSVDCGPACLRMVAKYHGKDYSLDFIRECCSVSMQGSSLLSISEAAQQIGFETMAVSLTVSELLSDAPLPCILLWNQNHYVVLPPQGDTLSKKRKIVIADPAYGLREIASDEFERNWCTANCSYGIALLFDPIPDFEDMYKTDQSRSSLSRFILQYTKPFKRLGLQILLGLVLSSAISLLFPFFTRSIFDSGIAYRDLSFVKLIFISQLALFIGIAVVEALRNRILIYINARINVAILTDFLKKLIKLPLRFFESRSTGDILQRIADHDRVEQFLTTRLLNIFFSVIILSAYIVILGVYSGILLLAFMSGSLMSLFWISFFLKKRRNLDYEKFRLHSRGQNIMLEILQGMNEIKIYNVEAQKRKEWEENQSRLFSVNLKALSLEQYQSVGNLSITHIKNIFIFFFTAKQVINGDMTFGTMLSISFIVGQMTGPIEQLLEFFKSAQDAKISFERISDVYNNKEEDEILKGGVIDPNISKNTFLKYAEQSITLKNITFQYSARQSTPVLKDISISIPKGTVTAVVGASGSGKTTLLKLLMKFYAPTHGKVYIGGEDFSNIPPGDWRSRCGVVQQDGYIFSASIARNIALGEEHIDEDKLQRAAVVANIDGFVSDLPAGYETLIGTNGNGISAGQKQRILIARAVYREPEFLFFDEATSALDATNEKIIMDNLNNFFKSRTVIVIAHRLSTVKQSDQIIVLERGQVVELGNHDTLIRQRGEYFNLVRNQLDLGE